MTRRTLTSEHNIPWLADLPDRWGVVRSKALFSPRKELARPDDQQLSATQAYGVIPQKEFESRIGRKVTQITRHLEKRRHVERDDFVISMRSFQGGLERAWARGCIRSSYVVLKPSPGVDVGYFSYLFKSHDYIQALRATANFIRDGQDLNFNNFCRVDLPLVPLEEQRAIARFLDHVDRRVRRYIRAKRQLIALLSEQKQAIIHRAVTRGFDPSVRLKPTDNTWFPEIPAHWNVLALKRILERPLANGLFKTKDKYGSGTRLVNVSDIYQRDFDVKADQLERVQTDDNEVSTFSVEVGDVFFVRSSLKLEGTGRSAVITDVPEPTVFECHLVRGRPKQSVAAPRYLAFLLNSWSIVSSLVSRANTVTMSTLPQPALAGTMLPLPPLSEQAQIVAHIEREVAAIEAALQRSEREIGLIREYRTRIVADVVTGKVDVRKAESQLSDEDEEGETSGGDVIDDPELDVEPEEVEA